MKIEINNMHIWGDCFHNHIGRINLGHFYISAQFKTGMNLIVGNLQDCGLKLSYTLCKGIPNKTYKCDSICYNNKVVQPKQLKELTYYVANEDKLILGKCFSLSTMWHLKIAKKKTSSLDINEMRIKFCLEENYINRSLHALSHNRLLYSSAVGYAYGKKIFCFPWISFSELKSQTVRFSILSKIAEEENLIFIIPVESAEIFENSFSFNRMIAKELEQDI